MDFVFVGLIFFVLGVTIGSLASKFLEKQPLYEAIAAAIRRCGDKGVCFSVSILPADDDDDDDDSGKDSPHMPLDAWRNN